MPNIPASGWYCQVTASGYTHEPSVIDGDGVNPQQNPQANSRPSIRLPVPKADKWRDILGDGSTDIDLDVWHDGARQPIDTLEDVDDAPGHTVLVGEGGRELKTRVEASYDQKAVHTAAQDLIDNNTTYVSNVDTPDTTTETNTTLVTYTTNSDWLTRTNFVGTDPVDATGGTLTLLQSLYLSEGEDEDRESGTTSSNVGDYSNGFAIRFNSAGDFAEWDFTTTYTIPEEHVGVAVRDDNDNGGSGYDIAIYLDGNQIDRNAGDIVLSWHDYADGTFGGSGFDGWDFGDLEPGTHTVRMEADGISTFHDIDLVALYDTRFSYNFDNSATDSNDALDGPELFPGERQVSFDLVPAPQAVTGIRAEGTIDEGASDYTHYLSNDQGANFTSGTGSNLETDSLGATFGPGITYKAGLSRTGTGASSTPTTGFAGTDLQALTLKADLEDMPLVVNRTFDGHLDAILRELAEMGDQLWEYRRTNGTESIEWTSPGQRTATRTPNVGDFRATKTVGQVYQKAIVYGQPDVEVRGERFESNHGTAVSLANDRLQHGSELVTDPDSGQRFQRGADYVMDYQNGDITTQSSGNMADATAFDIDYRYQAYGEFDDGTTSPNVTPRIDLPGLWTDFLCKQAARLIVNEVSTPIHTAEVTLPNDETGWSVVESIDPDVVPTGGNALHTQNVENTPEATVLTLGSRRSLSDVVGDIRAQIGAVSRKA